MGEFGSIYKDCYKDFLMLLLKDGNKLKDKNALISIWGCEDKSHWAYQSAYLSLKKILGRVIVFDPRKWRIDLGSKNMKKRLLNIISIEKPDYFFFLPDSKEMDIDLIRKINEISPKTKTIAHFGDDDLHFATRSRYYGLFVDCCLVGLGQYVSDYKKDGLRNAFPLTDAINTDHFRKLNLKKIYDVSFVGSSTPKSRVELARFLIDHGVKLHLWGRGWESYPEFNNIYHGVPNLDDYVRIINQTKINLAPSRGQYGQTHMTSRAYEIASCLSFGLADEHEEYLKYLGKKYKRAMFKDNNDLLKKINYFLKNEKEREKIAYETQNRVVRNHDMAKELKEILVEISKKDEKIRELPKLKSNFVVLKKQDFNNLKELKKKINDYQFISFSSGEIKISKFKNYLLVYALEKTGKEISCCEYSVSSNFEDYLTFKALRHLKNFDRRTFEGLLDLNQIAVRKDYFLKNLKKFKEIFYGGKLNFIKEENTAFIEIPLVSIRLNKIKKRIINNLKTDEIEKSFQFNFSIELYSLKKRKRLFLESYFYTFLLWSIINKNWFIFKYLAKAFKLNSK